MANRWGNNGNSETLFWGALISLQIVTAAMKIKRRLLLGRKAMTNLDSILKSRHYIANKGPSSQSYSFSGRIDAFELWCWRRLLRVPWTARRSNQSILKEISLKYSLEGLMLKLKLQYFGYLMQKVDSLEKTLMLGGIGGRRRRG